MIVVPSNDRKINNLENVIIDIISELQTNNEIHISMNGEGPCAEALGLYQLLDSICLKFEFPKNKVFIHTCNLIENHNEYIICKYPQTIYLYSTISAIKDNIGTKKQINEGFKHFGHFIGHSNRFRLQLASYLYSSHKDKLLQTFHCVPHHDYHKAHIGLEDMMFAKHNKDEIQSAIELLDTAPITIDSINSYPILMPETLNITKVYPNFLIELVSLSYFSGNTFYVDEKIWRPMAMKTPFMVQGPENFISNLQKLGFKTFGKYWNENYCKGSYRTHVSMIIENIKRISHMSIAEMEDMYEDMTPILDHNYNLISEISEFDFNKVFNG